VTNQPRFSAGPEPGYGGGVGGSGASVSGAQADPELRVRLNAATREFSCRELGELTGISHETARRYLDGRGPGIVFIKRLCETLNISADWLLLGRGSPVYRPGVPIDRPDAPVDVALEELSRHLGQLHRDLARAGEEPAGGAGTTKPAKPTTHGGSRARDITSPAPHTPLHPEVRDEDFVDPFAAAGVPRAVPPPLRGQREPAVSPIRLVLGPANGQQLSVAPDAAAEILVMLDRNGKARLAVSGRSEGGAHLYRRVFDRVYRWVRSGECDESTEAGRGV